MVYRISANVRLQHMQNWLFFWVSLCVVSAGKKQGSVEALCKTALDIEECISGVGDDQVHLLVADVVKSFDTVVKTILDNVLRSLGLAGWFC